MKKLSTIGGLIAFSVIAGLISCEKDQKYSERLSGSVYYINTTIPVSGVLLSIGGKTATTGNDGKYSITAISDGNHTMTAVKEGFENYSISIQIVSGSNKHDIELISYLYAHNLKGTVTSINHLHGSGPLESCHVVVLNPDGSASNLKSQTSSTGFYQILLVPQGNRTIRFMAENHETAEVNISMADPDYQLDLEIPIDPEGFIGTIYGGGILAYILKPGDSGYVNGRIGLIATPNDLGPAEWGCYGTSIGETGTHIGAGAANTAAIVAGCSTSGIAARLCYDLELNGYGDWFLPSKDELDRLYLNRHLIGGFYSKYYWSSSEHDPFIAWEQNFYGGPKYLYYKYSNKSVRAVRAF